MMHPVSIRFRDATAAERLQAEAAARHASTSALAEELIDEKLLRIAARAGRAVVTENARDFDRIIRAWAATGERHAGVIFTSPRRYRRGEEASRAAPGRSEDR